MACNCDCDCRSPINCYNDATRYKTMVVLHIIDLVFFIVRLALVSNDISKGVSGTMGFLIPILLFDLIASVPIIICDIIYIILRHCTEPLMRGEQLSPRLWHCATITCIRLNNHYDQPQIVLLTRIIFIICSFTLRFVCFVIGAACSARFNSQCTAYTVIAAFALVSSVLVIITEFIHYFRLWSYNPTETRNKKKNSVISADADVLIDRTHRGQLRFIHHSLLNDQNSTGFRQSRCQKPDCSSQSLHHRLLQHSLESGQNIDCGALSNDQKKSFIAFYQTSKQEALNIAQNGFPYGDNNNSGYKDYLHLKQSVFFTRSCDRDASSPAQAIICARLNLGRIEVIDSGENPNLNNYFGLGDGLCDTVYVKQTGRLYLRMPAQIEKWIIAIIPGANDKINDALDGPFYQPCL